jgi:hypothetical protein
VAFSAAAGFAACGANDDSIGPQQAAGNWAGATSQAKPMLFTVTSAGVSQATFTYVLQGSRCSATFTLLVPTTQPLSIAGGRFTIAQTQIGQNLFISATGRFASSTTATGTFVVQDGQCGDTLNLTWNATKQ